MTSKVPCLTANCIIIDHFLIWPGLTCCCGRGGRVTLSAGPSRETAIGRFAFSEDSGTSWTYAQENACVLPSLKQLSSASCLLE
jgi:hypothetical protein